MKEQADQKGRDQVNERGEPGRFPERRRMQEGHCPGGSAAVVPPVDSPYLEDKLSKGERGEFQDIIIQGDPTAVQPF